MSQVPAAPPTHADIVMPSEPPKWPKVVGIISIVWASIGVICNGCNLLGGLFQNAMMGMVPPEEQAKVQQQMQNQSPIQQKDVVDYILGVSQFPVAILLLVAGITLINRKPVARKLHLAYVAISALMWVASMGYFFAAKLPAHQEWLKSQADNPQAKFMTVPIILGMTACFGVIFAAWPVFCLIWFGLLKKRPEQGWAPAEADGV